MRQENRYITAESLESFLGSPLDPENRFCYKRAVEIDEAEECPEAECDLLDDWGLNQYFVPAELGGKLSSFEELSSLMRVVSRRDIAVTISYATTCVASLAVWVGGDEDQRRRLAELVLNKEKVAMTFHEKEHGNDLLGCEVEAVMAGDEYRLSGEKWVVGNPRRCGTLVVFARTDSKGGPRGFSMVLVEKRNLDKAAYSYLPKFKTHGVRGHEIAGIRFEDCRLGDSPILGPAGSGLEAALKSSQATRLLAVVMCLGAADTALRTTLNFALSRKLYGDTVFSLGHARRLLTEAFIDLLICECVMLSATRGLHAATDQMSIRAAVAKYFIPATLDQTLRNLSVVLGARHYLREGHCWGLFQKIIRDFPFTSVSHYSSVINLSHLAPHLQSLAERRVKDGRNGGAGIDDRLAKTFCLDEQLPPFDPARLSLNSRGRDDVVQGFEAAVEEVERIGDGIDPEVRAAIADKGRRLIEHLARQEAMLIEQKARRQSSESNSAEMFEMASRYSRLHAAAACLQVWLRNREGGDEFMRRGEWLEMSLERVLRWFEPERALSQMRGEQEAADRMVRLYEDGYLFSLHPWRLPDRWN